MCAGAEVLCMDGVVAIEAAIAAAPRAAVHGTLTAPRDQLRDLPAAGGGGAQAAHPDASIVYQLMQSVSGWLCCCDTS